MADANPDVATEAAGDRARGGDGGVAVLAAFGVEEWESSGGFASSRPSPGARWRRRLPRTWSSSGPRRPH